MKTSIHTGLQTLMTDYDPLWISDSESKLWVVKLSLLKPFNWIREECGLGDKLLIAQGNMAGWTHEWGELLDLLSGDELRVYYRPKPEPGEEWLYLLRREGFHLVGIKTIVYE